MQASWGQAPARLRVLSVLARYARSQAPMRLVLRAAVRLRLSVGLLPTGSRSLAFRAVCSRATLPQCSNLFGGSGAPCGGRACRGGPRPANGLSALARLKACAHSCALKGAALATLGRFGRDAPVGSTTFRPKMCNAPAGAFRPCGAPSVQLPLSPARSATFPRLR